MVCLVFFYIFKEMYGSQSQESISKSPNVPYTLERTFQTVSYSLQKSLQKWRKVKLIIYIVYKI